MVAPPLCAETKACNRDQTRPGHLDETRPDAQGTYAERFLKKSAKPSAGGRAGPEIMLGVSPLKTSFCLER